MEPNDLPRRGACGDHHIAASHGWSKLDKAIEECMRSSAKESELKHAICLVDTARNADKDQHT